MSASNVKRAPGEAPLREASLVIKKVGRVHPPISKAKSALVKLIKETPGKLIKAVFWGQKLAIDEDEVELVAVVDKCVEPDTEITFAISKVGEKKVVKEVKGKVKDGRAIAKWACEAKEPEDDKDKDKDKDKEEDEKDEKKDVTEIEMPAYSFVAKLDDEKATSGLLLTVPLPPVPAVVGAIPSPPQDVPGVPPPPVLRASRLPPPPVARAGSVPPPPVARAGSVPPPPVLAASRLPPPPPVARAGSVPPPPVAAASRPQMGLNNTWAYTKGNFLRVRSSIRRMLKERWLKGHTEKKIEDCRKVTTWDRMTNTDPAKYAECDTIEAKQDRVYRVLDDSERVWRLIRDELGDYKMRVNQTRKTAGLERLEQEMEKGPDHTFVYIVTVLVPWYWDHVAKTGTEDSARSAYEKIGADNQMLWDSVDKFSEVFLG
ncbi:hypothetical protein ACFL59_00970 [Planctomycetota bacterium]